MNKIIDSPSFFIGNQDENIISFGSGQPDLAPPKDCFENLKKYKNFKYDLVQGNSQLRNYIAKMYTEFSPENLVITNGASEAIDLTLRTLRLKSSGKILIPEIYYYSYPYNIRFAGFEVETYKLNDGLIDEDDLQEKMKNNCVAVLINSPSNPTGQVQIISTLKKLEKWAETYNCYIISDEVYKEIIYSRDNYFVQGQKVITINSFSKSFSMCGMRIGYLFSREKDFINQVVEIKTHTSMNTDIVAQSMALSCSINGHNYQQTALKIWKKRRDLMTKELEKLGLKFIKPTGAFYFLIEMNNSSQAITDLFYDYQVIVYDGAWFGVENTIRISYALDEDKIMEGIKRLEKFLIERRNN
jgi:aspartate aminotransferase